MWYARRDRINCKQFHFSSNSNWICFHLSTTYNWEFAFVIYLFIHFFLLHFQKYAHNRRCKKAESAETVRSEFLLLLRSEFLLIIINISLPYLCHSFLVFVANLIWCLNRCIRTIKLVMINNFGSYLTSPHFRCFVEFLSSFLFKYSINLFSFPWAFNQVSSSFALVFTLLPLFSHPVWRLLPISMMMLMMMITARFK